MSPSDPSAAAAPDTAVPDADVPAAAVPDAAVEPDAPGNPFVRLADFAALPRIGALALSVDGSRLAVSVATLDPAEEEVAVGAVGGRPGGRTAPPGG